MRTLLAATSAFLLALVLVSEASRNMFVTSPRPLTYVTMAAAGQPVAAYGQRTVAYATPQARYAQPVPASTRPSDTWLYAAAGALIGAGVASYAGRGASVRMQEETPPTPEAAGEAPKPSPAPAPVEEEGFDLSKYSMTISIATVFLVVKGLSSLGITIGPQ